MLGWLRPKLESKPPPDTRVYAVGDIHGQSTQLRALHDSIRQDAEKAAESQRVIVYVGDYIDRGPDSSGVLDQLIEKPLDGFRSVHLKGNHEDFMLRFIEGDIEAGAGWYANGGDATLTNYGIEIEDKWPDFSVLVEWREGLSKAISATQWRFLSDLALFHVEGDYAFVHAGVRPGVPLKSQDPNDLMWIREEFHASRVQHDYVIVHGHSVSSKAVNRTNRIGIDTGAGYGRALTAVVLSGAERRFLHA